MKFIVEIPEAHEVRRETIRKAIKKAAYDLGYGICTVTPMEDTPDEHETIPTSEANFL